MTNYGDRKLAITLPSGETTYRPCDDTFPLDLCVQAATGLPPFSYVQVLVCNSFGPLPLWKQLAWLETRPEAGWAAKGADWCRSCGKVAFDGAALPCGHSG